MATYTDIRNLFNDSDLLGKTEVACIIAANALIQTTPTTDEKSWASTVFANPRGEAEKALKVILASNSGLTIAQMQGASDSSIQSGVDDIVDVLVDARAGV